MRVKTNYAICCKICPTPFLTIVIEIFDGIGFEICTRVSLCSSVDRSGTRVSEVSLTTPWRRRILTRGRRCKSCVAWKLKRERSVSSATSSTKYGGSLGRGRMRLVGPSGFHGGAAAGFTPDARVLHQHARGSSREVDKSNAPNATIFAIRYIAGKVSHAVTFFEEAFHFTVKATRLAASTGQRNVISRESGGKENTWSGTS